MTFPGGCFEGGIWVLGRSRSCWLWIQHSWLKGELLPLDPGHWATLELPTKFLTFVGHHVACRRKNPNLQSEGQYLDFSEVSCLMEAIKSFFSQFWGRIWFLLCVPQSFAVCRDTPINLFHANISLQAPAFAL